MAGTDSIFSLIFLFIFGIVILFAVFFSQTLEDGLISKVEEKHNSTTIQNIKTENENLRATMDATFVMFFLSIIIGLVLSSFFLTSHPIFLIFNIIMQIVLIFIGGYFADIYTTIMEDPTLAVASDQLPYTHLIFTQLPIFGLLISIIGVVVLYGKQL